jgi:hypothetical protein
MLIFSSFQSKDTVNSEWSSLFWIDILLPWLTGVGVAILVIKKNGRDLKREIWNPIIPRMPRGMPLAHVRFQDPKIENTLELESIGSEKSSERSIKKTESRDKYPEEAVNTGNAEQQGPNVKPDIKNKIRAEPGKDHEQQLVMKGKGKGKGQSNFHKERTSLENKTYQIKEQQARELDTI